MRAVRAVLLTAVASSLSFGCKKLPPTMVSLAVSTSHTCGVTKEGPVMCWGDEGGVHGVDPWKPQVTAIPKFDELGLGEHLTCIRSREQVLCRGQEGSPGPSFTVVALPPVVSLRVFGRTACGATRAGQVYCTGDSLRGRNPDAAASPFATAYPLGDADVDAFAAGPLGVLTRRKDGAVAYVDYKGGKRELPALRDAISLAVGGVHACAVLRDATVRCFGGNGSGELGDTTRTDSLEPSKVAGLAGAVEVALGDHFSCASRQDGTVSCWGSNAQSQLTSGGAGQVSTSPTPVVGLFGAAHLAAAGNGACAALGPNEGVRCWGENTRGQLGVPSPEVRVPMPVRFPR